MSYVNCLTSMVTIDGNQLEGGGQLIRTVLSLSAILGKSIKIHDIRKKRPKPGLAAQHLGGVRLVAAISNGSLYGDKIGSIALEHHPGRYIRNPSYLSDCGTAGAISLLLQVSLPCLMFQNSSEESLTTVESIVNETIVKYKGGTNVNFSPPIDHTIHVLLPLLSLMTRNKDTLKVQVIERGYYPRGGGSVKLTVRGDPFRILQSASSAEVLPPNLELVEKINSDVLLDIEGEICGTHNCHNMQQILSPINLTARGSVTSVCGVVFGSSSNQEKARVRELLLAKIQSHFLPLLEDAVLAVQSADYSDATNNQIQSITLNRHIEGNDSSIGTDTELASNKSNSIDHSRVDNVPVTIQCDYEDCAQSSSSVAEKSGAIGGTETGAGVGTDCRSHVNKRKLSGQKDGPQQGGGNKKWSYEIMTTGAILWFTTESGCILSSNVMLQYKKSTRKGGADAFSSPISSPQISSSSTRSRPLRELDDSDLSSQLTEAVDVVVDELAFLFLSKACVDEHTADQLLIYMALAPGTSTLLCAPRCALSSLHIETVAQMAQDMCGAQFTIHDTAHDVSNSCRVITCSGVSGWKKT